MGEGGCVCGEETREEGYEESPSSSIVIEKISKLKERCHRGQGEESGWTVRRG